MAGQVVGSGLVLASGGILAYYTAWLVVTPLFDEDLPVQRLFPPRVYAIALPVAAGVLLFSVVAAFVGTTMLRTLASKKTKSA